MPRLTVCAWGIAASACTVTNVGRMPLRAGEAGDPFVVTGDLDQPYESRGPLQVTRKGLVLFGFWDPYGLDLQACMDESLLPELRRMGADGLINLRFEQTQYPTALRVLFAMLFVVPVAAEVTMRGEAVRLRSAGP